MLSLLSLKEWCAVYSDEEFFSKFTGKKINGKENGCVDWILKGSIIVQNFWIGLGLAFLAGDLMRKFSKSWQLCWVR